jgi:ABC-type polysaccharide/polyol phosphate transport system ATPase subunit
MTLAINVENLSKKYMISHANSAGSRSIREAITKYISWLGGNGGKKYHQETQMRNSKIEEFWALRDVSFEVVEGERVAIIGSNGAGKSTLLKILSRITEPTNGKVTIRGKVSSLLEVGTGFHPELSGRENIYLNGAILGMPRNEIRRKFDQIVDFSGVEKFLDTPVKHYSSGMYVRLAFSVSAWLDPDILIVDEVLSVGDQAFQKKCAGRMKELTGDGRTVIFVSHSMAAVKNMCDMAIYLNKGCINYYGTVMEAASEYARIAAEEAGDEIIPPYMRSVDKPESRGGTGEVIIYSLSVFPPPSSPTSLTTITTGGGVKAEVTFRGKYEQLVGTEIDVAIGIDTLSGVRTFTAVSGWYGKHYRVKTQNSKAIIELNNLFLRPGIYLISLALINHGVTTDSLVQCGAFLVLGSPVLGGIPVNDDFGATQFPANFLDGE